MAVADVASDGLSVVGIDCAAWVGEAGVPIFGVGGGSLGGRNVWNVVEVWESTHVSFRVGTRPRT